MEDTKMITEDIEDYLDEDAGEELSEIQSYFCSSCRRIRDMVNDWLPSLYKCPDCNRKTTIPNMITDANVGFTPPTDEQVTIRACLKKQEALEDYRMRISEMEFSF